MQYSEISGIYIEFILGLVKFLFVFLALYIPIEMLVRSLSLRNINPWR